MGCFSQVTGAILSFPPGPKYGHLKDIDSTRSTLTQLRRDTEKASPTSCMDSQQLAHSHHVPCELTDVCGQFVGLIPSYQPGAGALAQRKTAQARRRATPRSRCEAVRLRAQRLTLESVCVGAGCYSPLLSAAHHSVQALSSLLLVARPLDAGTAVAGA